MEEWIQSERLNYNITRLKRNDEVKFAEAEARNLLEKLNRLKSNKQKIWEKTKYPRLSKEEIDSRSQIKLPELKKKAQGTSRGYSKKYLSEDQIRVVEQACKVVFQQKAIEMNNINSSLNDSKMPVIDFVNANKDIWLKNVLLNIIRKEGDKIANKEVKIQKALEQGSHKLIRDEDRFKKFVEKEKNNQIQAEVELHHQIVKNKDLLDTKRKLIHDQKSIHDEIERIIKMIMISKSYAIFVCYSIGNKDQLSKYFNLQGFDFNSFEYIEGFSKDKSITRQVLTVM